MFAPHLCPHHRYQLTVVFLFILGLFVFIPYIIVIERNHLEIVTWGWVFAIPWMILYSKICLSVRRKIGAGERVSPLKRPIGHWVVLGIIIVYMNVLKLSDFQKIYPAIDAAFVVFSLFMADAYWDFRELKIRRSEDQKTS